MVQPTANNRETIESLLSFNSPDDFYYLVILKRKKEHPELGSNSYIVKHYYITSLKQLDFYWDEIVMLSTFHNARASINLNKRSFEALSFQVLKKVADQIMNKDFRSARKAYTSVCGSYTQEPDKKWIIDIDTHDPSAITYAAAVIQMCDGHPKDRIFAILDTKNGKHLISRPFNRTQFNEYYKQQDEHALPDIQTNNPTILYIP